MTMRLATTLSLVLSVLGVSVACSDDGATAPVDDAPDAATPSRRDASVTPPEPEPDAGTKDAGTVPAQAEVEPNDGNPETQTNAMKVPGLLKGAVGTADDQDIFTFDVAPGEWWQWTLTADSDLAPHLAVFDITPDNLNPPRVASSAAGQPTVLDHFVLRTGKFVAGVRDARNVPTKSGKGGPTFGYLLRAEKKTVAPVPVTFPSTKTGKLAGRGALDFYSFTATQGTDFGIIIRAQRKVPASTLDSRLTLFHLTSNAPIITNDNAGKTTFDSQVGGKISLTGDYLVVVENEGSNVADLSYEIVFQTSAPAPAP